MKILIFEWRDIKNPKAGGSEIYFHELAKKWIKFGNKVTIICGGWKGCKREEEIDGIKIKRVGSDFSQYLFAPFAYFNLKEKPDIIIDVENGIPYFTPLYAKTKKVLHIQHVHKDVWFEETKGKGIKEKLLATIGYLLETKLMPIVYRHKKVITISNSSKEEIEKELGCKVMGIINPGIEFYKYNKLGKSKKPSVLFMNRIKKYKGIEVLLQAVKELKDRKIEDIEFWVAGSGDYLSEMESYAKKNGLKNVKFLGRVSEEEKKRLMQQAWIFVNPSFKEGWGIVNIEANYFGTPVIGSNVGGIRDSVVNGKTGLLFEYGNFKEMADKIVKLVEDKKLRESMGNNATKWAKKFGWDSLARDYLKLLKKV